MGMVAGHISSRYIRGDDFWLFIAEVYFRHQLPVVYRENINLNLQNNRTFLQFEIFFQEKSR